MRNSFNRRKFIRATVFVASSLAVSKYKSPNSNANAQLIRSDAEEKDFDYIVVGSGAGGGPLACRLAILGANVLLIEAGQYTTKNYLVELPLFSVQATEDPRISWAFKVDHYADPLQREKDFKALDSHGNYQGIFYPRASAIGGSTVHNALIQMYPHDEDWRFLMKLTGDRNWNPEFMRRLYVKKIERCLFFGENVDAVTLRRIGHGKDGWLPTHRLNLEMLQQQLPQVIELWKSLCEYAYTTGRIPTSIKDQVKSGQDYFEAIWAGFTSPNADAFNLDCNTRAFQSDPIGLFVPPLSVNEGGRRGGILNYIRNTESDSRQGKLKGSLTVLQNTFVTDLHFSGKSRGRPTVTGVNCVQPQDSEQSGVFLYDAALGERIQPGQPFTLTAQKEVILCGGAYNTPQMLMLSGIGPKEHLQSKGIRVRLDVPGVGRNLQDRYEVAIVYEMKEGFELDCELGPNDPCLKLLTSDDPTLSPYSSNLLVIGMMERSDFAHFPPGASKKSPDLCLFAAPSLFRGYYPGYTKDSEEQDIPASYRPTKPGHMYLSWLVLKAHTKNDNGRVQLVDNNPFSKLNVNFAHFEEGGPMTANQDLDAVVHGVQMIRQIMKTEPFSRLEPKEVFESADAQTPEQIRDFVRNHAWGHHVSCTCKIGKADDPLAVLDGQFRVRGVNNLRVVDASVFPEIPGVFVALPIQMMAEKAAIDIWLNRGVR
ncbi:MAG: GMC family oxidoreductase [Leptolyngbyaceae cyanobacterium MO_188.B28]|nr:GMC family oxidoreductase [Leptolyngbyaceae cyanobacterium MO_188.B28]